MKKNALLRVLSLNSVSVGVSFVLGIVSSKIISVYLGPPGMAILGNFRNFSTMVKSVSTVGINNSAIRLIAENRGDKDALSAIYSTFFWIFLALSIVLMLALTLFAGYFSHLIFFSGELSLPVRILGLLVPMMALNVFWLAICNGFEKFRTIVLIQVFSNIAIFMLTVLLIRAERLTGGLLALAFGEGLMACVTFIFVVMDKKMFRFRLQKAVSNDHLSVIGKFTIMGLLSAVLIPLVQMLIRGEIVHRWSLPEAGIWDAANRLSGFYMVLFNSGLSLYYMPKLAALHTDSEFRVELKHYLQTFIPLLLVMLAGIFLLRHLIVALAFTHDFRSLANILIWQLAGDFIRIMSLAFGFQILVKAQMRSYFLIELLYNGAYLGLSFLLVPEHASEGALKAYLFANLATMAMMLWLFRSTLGGGKAA